ncbi:MAG: aspartate aminotransferase family protein [Clostridia bacterium]|nr:aspartate aminotransferase family protein [Clostridia bacterium]
MNLQQADQEYIANTYARFPLEIVSGQGALLKDSEGKEYIDLGSGIAVNTFGAADPVWAEAVTAQLNRLQHISNLYYTQPCVKLAQMLCEKTGMQKVFFSNSGAEGNECAIKAARLYAAKNKGKDYYTVITLQNSFHGRTITTLAATGQDTFHQDFTPLTEGFVYAPANDCDALKALVKEHKCAAIMMEPVQGEGGVVPLTAEFVQTARTLCDEENLVLIFDEVQTGNGRTGSLYAYMQFGITPDIVSTAKGLAGGLPLGATLLSEKMKDIFTPGSHGSTFGGNPVCCAGAISVLSRLDDTLMEQVKEKSNYIFETLSHTKGVKSVTGMGLMIGIETQRDAGQIVADCMAEGVLVLKAKHKVRLLPPLTIPMDLLQKAIGILQQAIEKE